MKLVPATLLIGLAALILVPCGQCRNLASSSIVVDGAAQTNATAIAAKRSNETEEAKASSASQPVSSTVIRHIVRRKRAEKEPTLPFEFPTTHMPCDLDQNGRAQVVDAFPNHCIWVWNHKYASEDFFRVFKTYQLEAFFFGQYYERLKRFEIDPHSWDYSNAGA
ncbi:hypothetical protein AWZ03_014284 [Drosophila navojoa]|uniref:HSF-type DNA-binding domain-containing protein n=1 Tax=Drosophila navojoa TaxID=7232 RepID=A0A484AUS0_DRONA|nr:uncharacterized protein LOC115565242 [Drosophila navojoa]TDG39295.1 hypothetical protein AWZ03_014284 [Drosophila navojoa]